MTIKTITLLALKIAVTCGIFWYLASIVDIDKSWQLIVSANPWYLLLNIIALVATNILMAWRWQAVAGALNLLGSFKFFFRGIYMGLYFNQILPGGIGGDGVKMVSFRRHFGKGSGAVTTVLFDRAAGFVAMMLLICLGLPISFSLMADSPYVPVLYALISVGGLAGFAMLFWVKYWGWVRKIKLIAWVASLSENAWQIFIKPNNGCYKSRNVIIISSLLIQLGGVLHFYLCAKALNIEVEFLNMLALIPPIFLLLIVPVSLAGWGLREGAVVSLFTVAGLMSSTEAATMSILYGVLLLITSLPGAITLFSGHGTQCPITSNNKELVS